MYADRTPPQKPPCIDCRIELIEDNVDAATIYMVTRRQIVELNGKPFTLSLPAVQAAMEIYGIEDKIDCLGRVMSLFHAIEVDE